MENTINIKEIHIGKAIETRWKEIGIPMERVCNFFKLKEEDILEMLQQKSIDCDSLLKWSKLLEYDFFRLYSQHLILYAPPSSQHISENKDKLKSSLPVFRKNIYTKEIISFIIGQINNKEKTKQQVIEEYKIPKTTLYKWISKYNETL